MDGQSPLFGDSPHSVRRPRTRIGGALSLSLGTHVAAAVVLALLATGRGTAPLSDIGATRTPGELVWLARVGNEGGLAGGGEPKPAPSRSAQLPGQDAAAVRAVVAPSIEPASDPQPPPDVPRIVVPLQPTSPGLTDLTGVLRDVALAMPDSRGPGSGTGADGGAGPGIGPGNGPGTGTRGTGWVRRWPGRERWRDAAAGSGPGQTSVHIPGDGRQDAGRGDARGGRSGRRHRR
jgi:hypothetical protein